LNENVTVLDYQNKKIILIATAHVSRESAELVKQVIEEEHPDSVCVELDEDRYNNILNPKAWENTDIIKVIKSKRVGFLFANLALSSYQKRIAKQLNTSALLLLFEDLHDCVEISVGLPQALGLRSDVPVMKSVKRGPQLFHEFKGHADPCFGHFQRIGAVFPWTNGCACPEHVAKLPPDCVPVGNREAEVVLHGLAVYDLVRVVVLE
jgi:hypothetical protein